MTIHLTIINSGETAIALLPLPRSVFLRRWLRKFRSCGGYSTALCLPTGCICLQQCSRPTSAWPAIFGPALTFTMPKFTTIITGPIKIMTSILILQIPRLRCRRPVCRRCCAVYCSAALCAAQLHGYVLCCTRMALVRCTGSSCTVVSTPNCRRT